MHSLTLSLRSSCTVLLSFQTDNAIAALRKRSRKTGSIGLLVLQLSAQVSELRNRAQTFEAGRTWLHVLISSGNADAWAALNQAHVKDGVVIACTADLPLWSRRFQSFLQMLGVCMIALDEAHACRSHSLFRVVYLSLGFILRRFGRVLQCGTFLHAASLQCLRRRLLATSAGFLAQADLTELPRGFALPGPPALRQRLVMRIVLGPENTSESK